VRGCVSALTALSVCCRVLERRDSLSDEVKATLLSAAHPKERPRIEEMMRGYSAVRPCLDTCPLHLSPTHWLSLSAALFVSLSLSVSVCTDSLGVVSLTHTCVPRASLLELDETEGKDQIHHALQCSPLPPAPPRTISAQLRGRKAGRVIRLLLLYLVLYAADCTLPCCLFTWLTN